MMIANGCPLEMAILKSLKANNGGNCLQKERKIAEIRLPAIREGLEQDKFCTQVSIALAYNTGAFST